MHQPKQYDFVMSGKKSKGKHKLAEIAKELSNLSENLANGVLHVGSHTVDVGDPVSFKLKEKMKDGTISYEISFRLPLQNNQEQSIEMQALPSAASRPGSITSHPQKKQKRAKEKVSVKPKKEIARLWKTLTQKVEDQKTLSSTAVTSLKELCAMPLYAGKEFQNDWLSCCNKVNDCLEAMQQNDFARAAHLVADVKYMIHTCHKKYK